MNFACVRLLKTKYQHMETYRSGHNGADSKFYGDLVVSSAGKPSVYKGFQNQKSNIFQCSLLLFSPKIF